MGKKLFIFVVTLLIVAIADLTSCTTAASFETISLDIVPQQVVVGQTAAVTARVKNNGWKHGVCNLTLKVNGIEIESKAAIVLSRAEESITFYLTRDTPDTCYIRVDGLSGTLNVFKNNGIEVLIEHASLPVALWGNEQVLSVLEELANDKIIDDDELQRFLDLDQDTIPNLVETTFLKTDPLKLDSDGDGIDDNQDKDASLMLVWKIGCCEDSEFCSCSFASMEIYPERHIDPWIPPEPEKPPCPCGIDCFRSPKTDKEWQDLLIEWSSLEPSKKENELKRFLPNSWVSYGGDGQFWIERGMPAVPFRRLQDYIITRQAK